MLNGSSYEDLETKKRPLNHFYDPVYDRGLTVTLFGTYEFPLKLLGKKNPDWALYADPTPQSNIPPQLFSYENAYNYFFTALTSNEIDKNENFARMFQSLGQVLHLLQDMAAIEHVRNDAYLVLPDDNVNKDVVENIINQYSRYELYTEELAKKMLSRLKAIFIPL